MPIKDIADGIYASGVEEIVDEMRRTLFEEGADLLRGLELLLTDVSNGRRPIEDLVREARRAALVIRSQTGALDLRLIGAVTHRMEDYFAEAKYLPPRIPDDVQAFIDILGAIFEGTTPLDADPSEIVRKLPAKLSLKPGDIQVRNVEIMLVMLHGTAAHYVERELQQCGYRTTLVTSTLEALTLILRTKPDMVIISAVMPELSGIDLAIGLANMPGTRNIPAALITSLELDDEYVKLVPKKVPVIRKGADFGDDLAQALDQLFII
jgi:CheY-like chemotaxis protein